MNKMMKSLLGKGPMVCEDTEQDIEKAEQSKKLEITEEDVEKAESSTKPKEPEQDIDKAESSTKPKEPEQDIDKAESSTEPEITIQPDEDYVEMEMEMEMEMLIANGSEKSTNLLREGEGSCCIFKIPKSLRKINQKGYEPEIVSIGPYHHGKEPLQMIEEHKHRFLQLFLNEAKRGVDVKVLGGILLKNVTRLKNSYSEKLVEVEQPKLLKMMLLDGCFILMLFFFVAHYLDASPDDPILTTPWILATLRSDLLLLENQVPLILLQVLLEQSRISSFNSCDLKKLAFKFFNLSRASEDGSRNSKAEHLLDLVRKNFIPIPSSNGSKTSRSSQNYSRLILSAKRLRLQGIEFKASHDHSSSKVLYKKIIDYLFNEPTTFVPRSEQKKTILEIKLYKNELHIPPLVVDEFVSSVLLNCVAFEQLSANCSNNITSYIVFMGCLVNDKADAIYLSEKGIIENYIGNASDVSQFFKNISNGTAFDMDKSYLKEEFEGINKYTSNRWNVQCAKFKHLHFDSPWTLLSSLVVLLAISLSILQTTLAVLKFLRSQ